MFFKRKYFYYSIKFDDEKTYWYRANTGSYRAGQKVVVPVTNNGKLKIGTVVGKQKFALEEIPYPLDKTKGILKKKGLFDEKRIEKFNKNAEKFPVLDISIGHTWAENGIKEYVTCTWERDRLRAKYGKKFVIIENYPPAKFRELPIEAQARIKREKQKILEARQREFAEKEARKEREFLEDLEFEMEMEDLDRYN